MTDTPRTDAAWKAITDADCKPRCDSYAHEEDCPIAYSERLICDFARDLERELHRAHEDRLAAQDACGHLSRQLESARRAVGRNADKAIDMYSRMPPEPTEGIIDAMAEGYTPYFEMKESGRMLSIGENLHGVYKALRAYLNAAPQPSTAKPEPGLSQESLGQGDVAGAAPCATCNDDPAVCATVPGLRHCEAAMRTL